MRNTFRSCNLRWKKLNYADTILCKFCELRMYKLLDFN